VVVIHASILPELICCGRPNKYKTPFKDKQ
jgi:hypothetical protein